jgi:hypothetical protein
MQRIRCRQTSQEATVTKIECGFHGLSSNLFPDGIPNESGVTIALALLLSDWGWKMRKIADPSKRRFDSAVRDSLSTIKEAQVQLHLLTCTSATTTLLASQIELYDMLLDEISGIQASFARDLKLTRLTLQVSSRHSLNSWAGLLIGAH